MTRKDAGMPPGQARGDRGSGRCGPAIEARRGGSGSGEEIPAKMIVDPRDSIATAWLQNDSEDDEK